MKILFVGNQGGLATLSFYLNCARAMGEQASDFEAIFTVYKNSERDWLLQQGVSGGYVFSFEDWVRSRQGMPPDIDRLEREYPEAGWSAVIASERSFSDYSLLCGGLGHRPEKKEYTHQLLERIVSFLERIADSHNLRCIVSQLPDTMFSYCAFKIAKGKGIKVFGVAPGWLFEKGQEEGGFLCDDEFQHSNKMSSYYRSLGTRELTDEELCRVDALVSYIKDYRGSTVFYDKTGGDPFKASVVSPKVANLFGYLKANRELDKNVIYTKFDPWMKTRANLLRVWRSLRIANKLETVPISRMPARSLFFAMHFQPEMSTLVQGIYHCNQVALIENISKALPLGYTLIVKEHPVMRGFRPAWQYAHLGSLHNVEFCDAPSKQIIEKCEAVITITGTVAMEALAFGKPAVVFGKHVYDYCELIWSVENPSELSGLLHRILIEKKLLEPTEFRAIASRFFLSYLHGLIPRFPLPENGDCYGKALLDDLAYE